MERQRDDPRTIFVQGLSFDIQEEQFEEAFSEVGPVRKCFLLKRPGQSSHKGAGFVQFALREDAERAAKEFDGKLLLGRRVQICKANKRAPLAERKQQKRRLGEATEAVPQQPAPKRARRPLPPTDADSACLLRSVALGNLSAVEVERAVELAAAAGEVEEVVRSVSEADVIRAKLREDGCTGEVVFIVYKSVRAAVEAVSKLHGASLSGKAGKRAKRKADPGQAEAKSLWARQVKGEGAMIKKWRVVVRNLPFNITPKELQQTFGKAGFVWDLNVPRSTSGAPKGFAFASFTSRAHGEKAIKLLNGESIKGRPIAVDWAVPKAAYQAGRAAEAIGGSDVGAERSPAATPDASTASEASKEASEAEDEEESEITLPSPSDIIAEGNELRALAAQLANGSEPAQPAQPAVDEGAEQARRSRSREAKKPSRPKAPEDTQSEDTAIGRTVFVRNLPGDVTKQQLQARLAGFGRVRACRPVMNRATQRCKGTAFVEFEEITAAQAAVEACSQGRSGEGRGVMLGGQALDVALALSQSDARALATQQTGASPKDRRNLYLAKEGSIEEGSAAWSSMSKGDRDKRQRAGREKAARLRSPNFFVSATRLSLRNLPAGLDEKDLKRMLVAAVKERAAKAAPKLQQVKVLRDPARRDAKGEPRSKGIAFAEFSEHEHALCALRQLNNNPALFGDQRRPIVEFAIENAQTLKKREQREVGKNSALKREVTTRPASKDEKKKGRQAPEQPAAKPAANAPADTSPNLTGQGGEPASEITMAKSGRKAAKRGRKKKPEKAQPESPKRTPAPKAASEARHRQAPAVVRDDRSRTEKREAPSQRTGAPKAARPAREPETTDAVDGLVARYKAALFGGQAGAGKQVKSGLKRWFE